jgi:hypothetical protein
VRESRLSRLPHRGKPPAMPGHSPRFGLYDGLRELLISAKRREIHNEGLPEPEPYEVGLPISRGIYIEAAEEERPWSAAKTFGRDVSRIGLAQGSEDRRRASDGPPRTYMHQHPAELRGVDCSWVPQGERCDSDCAEVLSTPEDIHGRALLGAGYFVSTVGLDENMFDRTSGIRKTNTNGTIK